MVEEATLGKFNFEKKLQKFQKSPNNKITCESFKVGSKNVMLKFSALIFTGKILSSEYGLSLPVTIDEDTVEMFQGYQNILQNFVESLQVDQEWETTDLLKDDEKIFLKLKFDKGKPKFKSNLVINAKKPQDTNVESDQKVEITARIKYYFNFDLQHFGLTLEIIELVFDTTVDDEEDLVVHTSKKVKI